MVMNNEVKKYLADTYFAGRIPGNLVRYLYDRYGEDPLEGELSPQFFWSFVISDVEAYIHGSLDITLRTPIQKLQDRYKDLATFELELLKISETQNWNAHIFETLSATSIKKTSISISENMHIKRRMN